MKPFWKGVVFLVIMPLGSAVIGGLLVVWLKGPNFGQQDANREQARGDDTSHQESAPRKTDPFHKDRPASASAEEWIQQLQRASDQLTPEIDKIKSTIAKRTSEIRTLAIEINTIKSDLKGKEEKVYALTKESVADSGVRQRNEAEADLVRRWDALKRAKNVLQAKEELLHARVEENDAQQERLVAMKTKQQEIKNTITTLEQELAAKTSGGLRATIDQTQMRKIHDIDELLQPFATVEELKVPAAESVAPRDPNSPRDRAAALEEIKEYFKGAKPPRD